MDLSIGSAITLRVEEDPTKLEGTLIGVQPGELLVVRLEKGRANALIREGRSCSATYLSAGVVYRLQSRVLGFLSGYDLVVLAFPETYETDVLRREPRFTCHIPATANIEKNALRGLVTDISQHGCQFIVKIPANFKLHRVSVLTDINLSLATMGTPDTPQLKGKVRNTNIDEFKIALGIEFEKMETQISDRLNLFIDHLKMLA